MIENPFTEWTGLKVKEVNILPVFLWRKYPNFIDLLYRLYFVVTVTDQDSYTRCVSDDAKILSESVSLSLLGPIVLTLSLFHGVLVVRLIGRLTLIITKISDLTPIHWSKGISPTDLTHLFVHDQKSIYPQL